MLQRKIPFWNTYWLEVQQISNFHQRYKDTPCFWYTVITYFSKIAYKNCWRHQIICGCKVFCVSIQTLYEYVQYNPAKFYDFSIIFAKVLANKEIICFRENIPFWNIDWKCNRFQTLFIRDTKILHVFDIITLISLADLRQ